jgi:hypothetical protein
MAEADDHKKDCQKKAAELGFDLSKQFLTLALAGIAFVVGLSFNTPGAISSLMLWLTVGTFGLSTAIGLIFLMRGVSLISIDHTYDIYATSLRALAGAQIMLVLVGVVLLAPLLIRRSAKESSANAIELRLDKQQTVVYPIDPNKNVTIEADGGKIKITAVSK